ncbi:hypothetical protein BJ944DRAFT_254161 [Cunninghamella echinulata]|nr:hypothetical protein BJ944DRAFT_254161 [Cunninghamella echinulata]
MMGFEFAQYVNNYLQQNGLATRTISKIDSNPAKSKHLETATTKLFDQEIDFCNLRTEVYTEDSRIPAEVTFGTPTEDAYRRDTTINSLFYNINTNSVEDFTNQGLSDLTKGLIRTPLEPYETFRDDPLRVLRCIRFASRFGFEMVAELSEAAKCETIRDALVNKISKERIGTEIEKMLNGPSPLLSMKLIHQYGLYSTVFEPPKNISHSPMDAYQAVRAVGAVKWFIMDNLDNQEYQQLLQQKFIRNNNNINYLLRQVENDDERHTLYLGAALLPYLNITVELKKKTSPAVELIIRDSLKLKNQIINTINTLFRGINIFKEASNHHHYTQNNISRSELGMIIRDIGALWKTSLKLALIDDLISLDIDWEHPDQLDINFKDAEHIISKYSSLLHQAKSYGIEDSHTWKPIIDGKKATQLLGLKPGPVVQELLKTTMIWQFENPQGSVDECATMLKNYWDNKQQS